MKGEPRACVPSCVPLRVSSPDAGGSSIPAAVRWQRGEPSGGGTTGKCARLEADRSKRRGEKFFLIYPPFLFTLYLSVVISFKMFEVINALAFCPSIIFLDPRMIIGSKIRFDLYYLFCTNLISIFLGILGFFLSCAEVHGGGVLGSWSQP